MNLDRTKNIDLRACFNRIHMRLKVYRTLVYFYQTTLRFLWRGPLRSAELILRMYSLTYLAYDSTLFLL